SPGAEVAQTPPTGQLPQGTPSTLPFRAESLALTHGLAQIGNGPRVFSSWSIKGYGEKQDDLGGVINLDSVTHQSSQLDVAFDNPELAYLSQVSGALEKREDGTIVWSYEDDNAKMVREVRAAPGGDYAQVVVK